MPAPTTLLEFIDVLARSNLLEKRQLDVYLNKLAGDAQPPASPRQLAQLMIRDGVLTVLQSGLLLRGKWKNFVVSGKYKLLEHLGTGGMGSVYLCEHVLMKRRVAIKVLPTDRVSDPVVLERFHREARAVASLDHRNIVRAYDIDRDGDMHFLVLEYVDGSCLQRIVEKFGPMPVPRAVNCIAQAADGLAHAHEAGLVHRDVKPANLLLDRNGTVKILDLGLALFFGDESGLTQRAKDNNILGTADYVAPEQALDSVNADARSDIYSLGMTFYFLLAGRSPYQDGSLSQKLMWHQISEPTPITELRPDLPKKLAAIIHRMLAKDPNERYQSPAEVLEALTPWDEGVFVPSADEMPVLCAAILNATSSSRLPALRPSALLAAKPLLRPRPRPVAKLGVWNKLMANPKTRAAVLGGTIAAAALFGTIAAVVVSR